MHGTPTFKTKALRLVSNGQLVKCLTIKLHSKYALLWQEFATHFVAKATPISYIDSKCHIKKLKSIRTCLIGYSGFIFT